MTFTELMLNKFPNVDLDNLMIYCCPCNFGYRTTGTEIVDMIGNCFIDCKACYNSPIINDDESITIQTIKNTK